MNPFQLTQRNPSAGRDVLPAECSASRTARFLEDLKALAAGVHQDQIVTLTLTKTEDRFQLDTTSFDEASTPLLALALLIDIERTLAAAEVVASALAPEWQERLIGIV